MLDAILQEFDNEAGTTRRVLERVPTDKLAWKPHAKSMSLGVLALGVPARVVQSVPGVPALAVADMCNGRSFPRRFCYADESQQQLPSKSKIQTRQTVQTI